MSILKLPEIKFTIPRKLGIAANLTRGYGSVFAVLEGGKTRVEKGDLFIDPEGLGEDRARKTVARWIECLGFKHVENAAVAGVAGDRLMRLTTRVIETMYPGKLNVYLSVLPSRDEPPYRVYTALRDLSPGARHGLTVAIDYDKLWGEVALIESGRRKTPRQVVADLLSTTLSTVLNDEIYEKLRRFRIHLFIPAVLYSVSDRVFENLKGALRIAEYAVLADYRSEDVGYALLYIDGTGFEGDVDKTCQEFKEWALGFKNLVDTDIVYGRENKRRIVLFLGVRRLNPETYGYISEKCLSLKDVEEDLSPAVETIKSLGLM